MHFVVKGEFPLLANSSRNLTVPFTALVDALKYDAAHINTAHLSPVDISLLEYATLAIFILAGLAVLFVTTAPAHERLAFVFFVLQLGLLSSQIWTSTFGDGRSLIEPYLMALVLLMATPRRYLNWLSLGMIVAYARARAAGGGEAPGPVHVTPGTWQGWGSVSSVPVRPAWPARWCPRPRWCSRRRDRSAAGGRR